MKKKWIFYTLCAAALTLAGCQTSEKKTDGKEKEATETKLDTKTEKEIKAELKTMQTELAAVKEANASKDQAKLEAAARTMHKHWLDFENKVRSIYPLEYSTVEKFETPIFYSAQNKTPDHDDIQKNIEGLEKALTQLSNAKQTKEKTSEVLDKAIANYKAYLVEQSELLVTSTKAMTDAIEANNIDLAKENYAKARVFYERIEPVAESFGDLDPAIDARINDVEDPADWTGFHVIERALWEKNTTADLTKINEKLTADVKELQTKISTLKMKPREMIAGAMELLNEAATTKITGEEEAYSHLDLVDLAANVEGSKIVYQSIIPALNANDKSLADKLDAQFNKMEDTLSAYQQGASYKPYNELSKEQIREISNELSTLAELMSQTGEVVQ